MIGIDKLITIAFALIIVIAGYFYFVEPSMKRFIPKENLPEGMSLLEIKDFYSKDKQRHIYAALYAIGNRNVNVKVYDVKDIEAEINTYPKQSTNETRIASHLLYSENATNNVNISEVAGNQLVFLWWNRDNKFFIISGDVRDYQTLIELARVIDGRAI